VFYICLGNDKLKHHTREHSSTKFHVLKKLPFRYVLSGFEQTICSNFSQPRS